MTKKSKGKKTKTVTGVMNFTYNGPVGESDDLPTLEKKLDLASARLTYALQQKLYWDNRAHQCGQTFNIVCVAYRKKKCGFTDAEIQGEAPTSTAVWSYAK